MSDKRKKPFDSTTDFFLNYMKSEKEAGAEDEKKKIEAEDKHIRSREMLLEGYNTFNKFMDALLNGRKSLKIISFLLALALFVSLSGGDMISYTTSGATITDVPVSVENLDDKYEVSGVPESVTIGLIGPSLDIYLAQIQGAYEVYCDLADYTSGTYTVSLKTRGFDDTLTVMCLPETASITVSKKVEETFSLATKFINEDQLDEKYAVSVSSVSKDEVTVSAAQSTIDDIEEVCAVIDVANVDAAFTQVCNVKAYDADGEEVDCDISPSSVSVECTVDSYSKVVAIKPDFKGDLKSGYTMKNYKLSPSTVTIYGKRSDIGDITSLSVDVDIDGLSGSTTLTGLAIETNDKISKMSEETIDIEMTIEKDS